MEFLQGFILSSLCKFGFIFFAWMNFSLAFLFPETMLIFILRSKDSEPIAFLPLCFVLLIIISVNSPWFIPPPKKHYLSVYLKFPAESKLNGHQFSECRIIVGHFKPQNSSVVNVELSVVYFWNVLLFSCSALWRQSLEVSHCIHL